MFGENGRKHAWDKVLNVKVREGSCYAVAGNGPLFTCLCLENRPIAVRCIGVMRLRLPGMPFPLERFLPLRRFSFQAAYSPGRIVEAHADGAVGVDWLRDKH